VVSDRVADLTETFGDQAAIAEYLAALRTDIIDNAELFLMVRAQEGQGPFPEAIRQHHRERAFDRYKVNVMVSREQGETGAPVIHEDLPSFDHLTGRIEHISEMGALLTNFTMIKPGALHRANGGYLVLDARDVLREPLAWDALKRCLKTGSITITTVAERMGFASTTQLEPDPIPLDVRVVLVGDRMLHALLMHLDPDFSELFKLQADFEEAVVRDDQVMADYARSIATLAQTENLLPIAAPGMARLIEESIRLADDSTKLTLRVGQLADILREADHYARAEGRDVVSGDEVARSIDAQEWRASRVRDRIQESIERGILTIATEGEAVGQINGLSVASLNGFRFGRPSRITARVRMGSGKLVDIEREVELGGPLHSKGVMILSGYLTASFAPDAP
ncbi:MAG: AAA family ATPase, partial [Alphaproteobacteria bacterium]|nr:AAA family ATPase [Alphaproteobacteria bacterium]